MDDTNKGHPAGDTSRSSRKRARQVARLGRRIRRMVRRLRELHGHDAWLVEGQAITQAEKEGRGEKPDPTGSTP